ncbi:MAG: hypothetical protein MJ252_03540 [archaeon]|nr:hypothetical protein [archaeon]
MDCMGDSVRVRACNTQPCPNSEAFADKGNEGGIDYSKITVKTMPISNKPQRYDKCVIMERDALIVQDEPIGEKQQRTVEMKKEKNKLPIRLVMNAQTIVAYTDAHYLSPYKTFDLRTTKLFRKQDKAQGVNSQCFILKDTEKAVKAEICQLDCTAGVGFVEEWDREIQIFRDACHAPKTMVDVDLEFQNKVSELKDQFERKQQKKRKEERANNEIKLLYKKKAQAEVVSLAALDKEKRLEQLLEQEEEQREKNELHELQKQMENEKKKTGCLVETLQDTEMNEKYLVANDAVNEDISKIQNKAQSQLNEMREKAKRKLISKRLIHQRKVEQMKSQIMSIRSEAAVSAKKIGHIGDASNCFIGGPEKEKEIELYCAKAFLDDGDKYVDCKNYDSFCYACCEYEFGEGHTTKRDQCYHTQCEEVIVKESTQFRGLPDVSASLPMA